MKKKLMNKYSQVFSASSHLQARLEELSVIASEVYGEELIVALCNGEEIEFRTKDNPDGLKDMPAIRIEDVLAKLNSRKDE